MLGSTTAFSAATTTLALEGYTISLSNYTGTTGYGQSNIYKLLGKCGTLDVEDVHASTLFVINNLRLARFGEGEVFVWGRGVTVASSRHILSVAIQTSTALRFLAILSLPAVKLLVAIFQIGFLQNLFFQDEYPIKSSPQSTDFLTKLDTSEFRDGFLAPHVTPRIFGALYAASASTALINYIEKRHRNAGESKRIPPVLPAIGASDQRVSPTQGIGFYHLLKGAGETTEVLIFDREGHPLDGVWRRRGLCRKLEGTG